MKAAVIMAGGYGERFWPLSRKSRPKQCLPIHTKDPMIKETIDRIKDVFKDSIYISTGQKMADEIKKIMPDTHFIIEPMARNTAACIGLSAITLLEKDKDAIMFLETADHIYDDVKKYLEHIEFALDIAKKEDKIVLIGIKPTHAHTGYGYIELGDMVHDELIKVHKVKAFREKPDKDTAEKYVGSGKFMWNSGMFIAKCKVMLDEIKVYMPKLFDSLNRIRKSGFDDKILFEEFEKIEKVSIDYGVMEKSDKTYVIRADMHWDDIGDLRAFERFVKKDGNNNAFRGKVVEHDSRDNIVINESDKITTLLGVEGLIVTVTDDAILVTTKENAQNVKHIVNKLDKEDKKYTD